jgi:Cd2+/Zn2+-exporting ATPase
MCISPSKRKNKDFLLFLLGYLKNNSFICSGKRKTNKLIESNMKIAPILSAILLAGGLVLQHYTSLFEPSYVSLVYYLVAFLPVGLPVFKEAFEEMKEGDVFSEFTLMSLAAIGAFCIGEYPEAVAVMLFYTVGEILQDEAVDRASRNISNLLDVRPERTLVERGDVLIEVAPSEVKVGEMIELKPGERVPLDGELTNPEASFDTSALTGESVPRTIRQGEQVLAGMIVSDRTLRIRVTKPYDQSTLARILALVKDATERKAPTELFIRKFARIYTPIVIGLAAAIVLLPALFVPLRLGYQCAAGILRRHRCGLQVGHPLQRK